MKLKLRLLTLLALLGAYSVYAVGDEVLSHLKSYPADISKYWEQKQRDIIQQCESSNPELVNELRQHATVSRMDDVKWWGKYVGLPATAFAVGVTGLMYYLKPDIMPASDAVNNCASSVMSSVGNFFSNAYSSVSGKLSSWTGKLTGLFRNKIDHTALDNEAEIHSYESAVNNTDNTTSNLDKFVEQSDLIA